MSEKPNRKIFETTTVRLSADETRSIIRIATLNGKPYQSWGMASLEDMRIVKKQVIKPEATPQQIAAAWGQLERRVKSRNLKGVQSAVSALEKIVETRRKEGYVLTDLGKELARGVLVGLSKQFPQMRR